MTELATKLEPTADNVNGILAAVTLEGLIDEMTGERADTGNSTDVEAPPPGSGLNTKTTAFPSLSMSVARILEFNCVELTNEEFRSCPPKYTMDPGMKFAPLICSVKGVSVATDEDGESGERVGAGFSVVDGPIEIANWPPLLIVESVQGVHDSGVKTPEAVLIE
jgi:hypothetical protein